MGSEKETTEYFWYKDITTDTTKTEIVAKNLLSYSITDRK